MTSSRKRDEPPSTRPGHRLGGGAAARARAVPPVDDDSSERQRRSEAPTLPPPAPSTKRSGIRAKRKSIPNAATIDEVVADLSKDPRREDDDD